MFQLDPKLLNNNLEIGRTPLCRLLLANDSRFPWLILVPTREAVTEIYQLSEADQQQLIRESSLLAQRLAKVFQAHKLNVAALGNLVPQLHIHHVVRYRTDPSWPSPIWGQGAAQPYTPDQLTEIRAKLKGAFPDWID